MWSQLNLLFSSNLHSLRLEINIPRFVPRLRLPFESCRFDVHVAGAKVTVELGPEQHEKLARILVDSKPVTATSHTAAVRIASVPQDSSNIILEIRVKDSRLFVSLCALDNGVRSHEGDQQYPGWVSYLQF